MSKIYNEIVIDMNPESPTFEETLYEDSFDYEGDMMLAQGGVPPSTQPDADEYLSEVGQNSIKYEGKYYYYYADGFKEIDPSTAPGFNETSYKDVTDLMKGFEDRNLPLSERGLGMGDVTAEQMLGKTEDEMLQWIIDTRYGGELPKNPDGTDQITRNDILTQIRTKLPQKGGMETTDWYGIQGTAGKVGSTARSVYGGMGAGARQEIAGQKQIGKDIYALEEGKGKDWTSKFRTFLSSLPTATGT